MKVEIDAPAKLPCVIPEEGNSIVSRLTIAAKLVIYKHKNRVRGRLAAGYLNLMIKLIKVNAAVEIKKV